MRAGLRGPPRARTAPLLAVVAVVAVVAPAAVAAAGPRAVELSLSAAVGMQRVDGEGLAALTPRLGLRTDWLELLLAPSLRMVVVSDAGDFGLRDRDWDDRSELLRPLEHLIVRDPGGRAGLTLSGSRGLTLGRGAVVDGYRSALLADHHRTGLHAFGRAGPLEVELFSHDVTAWQVMAARLALRPFGGSAPPETGLGSLTFAIDVAQDQRAPLGVGAAAAPLAIVAGELRLGLLRGERLALALWLGGGASSHDQRLGVGAEAGAVLGWLDASRRRRLVELSLAPGYALNAYLPGRFDAAYELERPSVAAWLQRADRGGGLGASLRARARIEPLPGVALRAEARVFPAAPADADLDAYAAALSLQELFADLPGGGLAAELGWMRRPGGVQLAAGSASWAFWPQLRAGVRVERALHQRADRAVRRTWDLELWVAVGL